MVGGPAGIGSLRPRFAGIIRSPVSTGPGVPDRQGCLSLARRLWRSGRLAPLFGHGFPGRQGLRAFGSRGRILTVSQLVPDRTRKFTRIERMPGCLSVKHMAGLSVQTSLLSSPKTGGAGRSSSDAGPRGSAVRFCVCGRVWGCPWSVTPHPCLPLPSMPGDSALLLFVCAHPGHCLPPEAS